MSIKNLEIKPSEAKAVEIASLPTRPTSSATYGGRGLTAQEMKKAYDAYPALIKERFNALIADLLSGIAINDIPFSIPSHEPFGENIEQTVKGFLDAVGGILDFGTDDARTIFGFVKQFVSDVAFATSLEYDKNTQLLSLTIDGEEKSVKIDLDEFKDEITILKDRMELAETDIGALQTDMSVAKDDIENATLNTVTGLSYDENEDTLTLAQPAGNTVLHIVGITILKQWLSEMSNDYSSQLEALWQYKFPTGGGTIEGDVDILGNLNVLGKTIQTILEDLNVEAAVIATNANGATLTTLSGFVTRINLDTTYGIMYDPASNSVKLGLVTADENGVWRFADGEGSPVATRADSASMNDGKVVTWDAEGKRIKTTDIPAAVDDTPTENSSNLITSGAVYSAIVQTLNTEV